MLEDPARHFLVQRMKQVAALGRVPAAMRAERFLEDQVRPATDSLVQATNLTIKDEPLAEKLRAQRKRLDAVRVALAAIPRQGEGTVRVSPPKTRMARQPRASI
jgi:hypothetical protein